VTGADATGFEMLATCRGAVVVVVGLGIDAAPTTPSAWTLPPAAAPFGRVVGAVVTAAGGWVVDDGFVLDGAGLVVVGFVVAGDGRVVVGAVVVGIVVGIVVGVVVWSGDPVRRAAAEGADAGLVAGGAADRGGAPFASANAAPPRATSTMSPTAAITEARAMRPCRMVLPAMVLLDVVRALRPSGRFGVGVPWARSIPPRSPLSAIIRLRSVKRVTFHRGRSRNGGPEAAA
jgi:hypothetical protein